MENRSVEANTVAGQTLRVALRAGGRWLSAAGIESARLDTELLLRDVLGIDQAEFYLRLGETIAPDIERSFWELLQRRARREPVAYITGRKEFWSLDFIVTPDVLIPRPETELLVETALKRAQSMLASPLKVLDIGTGSGAIAVCLANELSRAQITAVDISKAALQVARANAECHGVADRIRFAQGDLWAAVADEWESFDLIVANPPYIRSGDLSGLAPEIREWEPILALDGGTDGLDYYRRIASGAQSYLTAAGDLLLEIGDDMGEAVTRIFAHEAGYELPSILRDYTGKDRVLATRKATGPQSVKGPGRG
jgi:release factor glutamine methyltransferase